MIALSSVTYRHYKEQENISEALQKRYEIAIELEKLISHIKDAETGDRGFTLTNDSIFLEPYLNARSRVNQSFNKLKIATRNNEKQQEHLKKIYNLVDNRFVYFKMQFSTGREFKNNLRNGKLIMDSLRIEVNEMIDYEKDLLVATDKIYELNSSNSPIIIFTSFLVAILIIVLGYLKLSKNYNRLLTSNAQLRIFDESSKQAEILGKYGSWTYNLKNNEFYFSENFYRLYGYEPHQKGIDVETFINLVHPEDLEGVQENFTVSKTREFNAPFPFRIFRSDNNQISHLRVKSKMFTTLNGDKILIGATRDITEEYESTQIIEERNIELEKTVKELTEFNHVASHDLQEPLRKIQTFISRIEDKELDKLSDNGKAYFDRIKSAASRMRILIDDLLQYSRTSRSKNDFEKVNLNDVIENIVIELSEPIKDKKATIEIKKLPKIKGVVFQLNQLFTNLISNSLKYSKEDISPIIEINSKKVSSKTDTKIPENDSRKFYRITFTDNGIGFEQEHAEKIFNLFQRLHGKTDYPGTGVGLAICKKIVDNHKGYIFAESTPGEGATFLLYLPA
ncbi:sensor histidine kinase [Flavobacterium okayamense]|uniref:sensor histidine kinase n=1 Tax=Flavobacterium okayamense TaxID=2830782 RepID=UPI001C84CD22|nr:sensor histidine kinase [Flavobacterium okayamense]